MDAASLSIKRTAPFRRCNKTLETLLLYNSFRKQQSQPAPDCQSTGWSTDPFHRSTGRPTESWVLLVGRPGGRPSSILVYVVHVGRPGRSTEHLLLRAVDRTSAPAAVSCFLLLLLPSSFVVDFFGDHSTTLRRSLSTSSAILLSFQ